jgi:hypothetical protein
MQVRVLQGEWRMIAGCQKRFVVYCPSIPTQEITPHIYMADSDFDAITNNRAICNSDGNVGPKEFCEIMTKEIRLNQF